MLSPRDYADDCAELLGRPLSHDAGIDSADLKVAFEATKERFFQGNLIFASKHCFNLVTHSRRDDLISLAYLLLYLIDGDLAFLTKEGSS